MFKLPSGYYKEVTIRKVFIYEQLGLLFYLMLIRVLVENISIIKNIYHNSILIK